MKRYFHHILISIICIISAIITGSLLMIAVYSLPVSNIRKNVSRSLDIYTTEGDYYSWAPEISSAQLDNFTDTLMLNIASFKGNGSVINQAMNNSYITYDDEDSKSLTLAKALSDDSINGAVIVDYPRYWHGYLIWLKPLLCFMTMSDIRILLMCFQLILAVYLIIEIYQKSSVKTAFPIGLALLCLNPVSTALCMQYACIYTLTLTSILVMLKAGYYKKNSYYTDMHPKG